MIEPWRDDDLQRLPREGLPQPYRRLAKELHLHADGLYAEARRCPHKEGSGGSLDSDEAYRVRPAKFYFSILVDKIHCCGLHASHLWVAITVVKVQSSDQSSQFQAVSRDSGQHVLAQHGARRTGSY